MVLSGKALSNNLIKSPGVKSILTVSEPRRLFGGKKINDPPKTVFYNPGFTSHVVKMYFTVHNNVWN